MNPELRQKKKKLNRAQVREMIKEAIKSLLKTEEGATFEGICRETGLNNHSVSRGLHKLWQMREVYVWDGQYHFTSPVDADEAACEWDGILADGVLWHGNPRC